MMQNIALIMESRQMDFGSQICFIYLLSFPSSFSPSFYLKLLKVQKYRSQPSTLSPTPTPERTPSVRPPQARCATFCFSLSMFFFAIGIILTTIFLMIAQETKRRRPEEDGFSTSYTLCGLFLILAFSGIIEFLSLFLHRFSVHLFYILSIIWMLPLLRLDGYISGSHAYALIPSSLILLASIFTMIVYICYAHQCSLRNLLTLFAQLFIIVGYVWWIIRLDCMHHFSISFFAIRSSLSNTSLLLSLLLFIILVRSNNRHTFYNYTEAGIWIDIAILLSSVIIPLTANSTLSPSSSSSSASSLTSPHSHTSNPDTYSELEQGNTTMNPLNPHAGHMNETQHTSSHHPSSPSSSSSSPSSSSSSSSSTNNDTSQNDSHAIQIASSFSSLIGTSVTLLQFILCELWQDGIIDCHYGIVLIPAWLSILPLVILALCSMFCSRTILDLLPTLYENDQNSLNSAQSGLPFANDPIATMVEAEKRSTVSIPDAVQNFLNGHTSLSTPYISSSSSPSSSASSLVAPPTHPYSTFARL